MPVLIITHVALVARQRPGLSRVATLHGTETWKNIPRALPATGHQTRKGYHFLSRRDIDTVEYVGSLTPVAAIVRVMISFPGESTLLF